MAQRSTPDGWVSPADAPSNVRVTVVPGPRGRRPARPFRSVGLVRHPRSARIRASVRARLIIAAIAAVVAAGAIIAVAPWSGRPASVDAVGAGGPRPVGSPAPATEEDTTGAPQIAAYRYPLGCLGITLSSDRSSMLGAPQPVLGYGVYVTAVLRRVNGVWRLALEATSPRCPAVPLRTPSDRRSSVAATAPRRRRSPASGRVARLLRHGSDDQPGAAAACQKLNPQRVNTRMRFSNPTR